MYPREVALRYSLRKSQTVIDTVLITLIFLLFSNMGVFNPSLHLKAVLLFEKKVIS